MTNLIPEIPKNKEISNWVYYKLEKLFEIIDDCNSNIYYEYQLNNIERFFIIVDELNDYLNE